MRKFSLLLGTLGGAMGAYLLSNSTLRKELSTAKDPEAAAKMLGKHLQRDSKMLLQEVQTFVESDDVQANVQKAKLFAAQKLNEAKKQANVLMKKGAKQAEKMAKKEMAVAKKKAAKVIRKVKKKVAA